MDCNCRAAEFVGGWTIDCHAALVATAPDHGHHGSGSCIQCRKLGRIHLGRSPTSRLPRPVWAYFLLPLVNVVIGLTVFGERIDVAQKWGVAFAVAAVAVQVGYYGGLPLVALSLALTFGLYGAIRKGIAIESMEGLLLEALIMLPFAIGWLIYRDGAGLRCVRVENRSASDRRGVLQCFAPDDLRCRQPAVATDGSGTGLLHRSDGTIDRGRLGIWRASGAGPNGCLWPGLDWPGIGDHGRLPSSPSRAPSCSGD